MAGGAGSEALGYVRRRRRAAVVAAKGRLSLRDRVVASLLFMAHVLLGYLLMLCAMTYQFEFLFAVCVGLGAGHLAFDDGGVPERPDRALRRRRRRRSAARSEPLLSVRLRLLQRALSLPRRRSPQRRLACANGRARRRRRARRRSAAAAGGCSRPSRCRTWP